VNDARTKKRSRALLTMRMHDENTARRSQAEALCRLQVAESRIAILGRTLEQYDQAAGDELLCGAAGSVLGRFARATADIRKELARVENERRLANEALLASEAVLLDAYRARKSADQHHQRIVRMIALKRASECDQQIASANRPYADGSYNILEQPDAY